MAEKKLTFEQSMARLGDIVARLEGGEAPLEESLKLFEEGAKLISACQKQLDTAEQKVLKLRRGEDGAPEESPFLEEQ